MVRAQDMPKLPRGWRQSASGGLHKRKGGWVAVTVPSRDGYQVAMRRLESQELQRWITARTLEDALAEADEVMDATA